MRLRVIEYQNTAIEVAI